MRTSWKSITASLPPWAERTTSLTNGCTIGIATMRKRRKIWQGLPSTKPLVSMTRDRTLRSRVTGNGHARFWIGGGGSNPVADHTQRKQAAYVDMNLHRLLCDDHMAETLERLTINQWVLCVVFSDTLGDQLLRCGIARQLCKQLIAFCG